MRAIRVTSRVSVSSPTTQSGPVSTLIRLTLAAGWDSGPIDPYLSIPGELNILNRSTKDIQRHGTRSPNARVRAGECTVAKIATTPGRRASLQGFGR